MRRHGRSLEERELAGALEEQQSRVTEALQAFADNTMRYLREEGRLLAEGIEFPPLGRASATAMPSSSPVGPGHKRDLRIVRPYVRDFKPVLVAVDGGAEALREEVNAPDVSSETWTRSQTTCFAAAPRCSSTPTARAMRPARRAAASGPPLPDGLGAGHLGGHRAPAGAREGRRADRRGRDPPQPGRVPRAESRRMSSTFVTRLKVGEILIDAKGVSRLVSRRIGVWPLVLFSALAALSRSQWRSWPHLRFETFRSRLRTCVRPAPPRRLARGRLLHAVVGILIGVGISGRGFVDDAERDRLNGVSQSSRRRSTRRTPPRSSPRSAQRGRAVRRARLSGLVEDRLEGKPVAVLVLGSRDQAVDFVRRAVGDGDGRLARMRAVTLPLRLDAVESTLKHGPSSAATSATSSWATWAATSDGSWPREARRRSGTHSPPRSSRSVGDSVRSSPTASS